MRSGSCLRRRVRSRKRSGADTRRASTRAQGRLYETHLRRLLTPAVGSFVGGAVVFGVGAHFWVRRERSGGVLAAAAIGSGVAMTLSGALLIATDEDEHDEGYQRPTYRDTAAMGVVLAAEGLASTALGAVLLYRDRSVPVVPITTVADHHVVLSLSGAF